MLDTDFYFAEKLMDLRVQEEHHQAELRRLQREAQRAHQGRPLCQLGSLFVSVAARLLHAGLPQPRPAGEQMLVD